MFKLFKGDSMTGKSVLSIGQCRPDQAAISHYLTSHFRATVLTADLAVDAYRLLKSQTVDLVLINRKLDADYSDGMEILRRRLHFQSCWSQTSRNGRRRRSLWERHTVSGKRS
jgi:hypothetical protein